MIWWARAWGCKDSPLGRLLMLRGMDGEVPTDAKYTPKDKDVNDKLLALSGRAPGCVSIERCSSPRRQRWTGLDGREVASLGVAQLHRDLDLRWRRTSYSAITSGAHAATSAQEVVGSEPEGSGTIDEPAAGVDELPALPRPATEQAPLQAVPCIMGPVPGGREVGTFVHRVLARADFAAEDLDGELVAAVGAEWARRPPVLADAGTLVDGLRAAICTPLSPLAAGLRLRDLRRTDRLDELAFELPLAGGDQAAGEVLMADLSGLFTRCVRPGSTLAGYAARLGDPLLVTGLRGYLTGSLDLVFRSGGTGDVQRFFVADYKTNLLAAEGEALSAWHYQPALMEAEMCRAHYPLQALFYLVALHRYLRWRLPGYRPEENLRRRAVPVRAGDARARHPARGRPGLWRLFLATAGVPGHRAVRPLGHGPKCHLSPSAPASCSGSRSTPCSARSTPQGSSHRLTCTSRCAWRNSRVTGTSLSRWLRPLLSGPRGWATCTWTSLLSKPPSQPTWRRTSRSIPSLGPDRRSGWDASLPAPW